MCDDYLDYDLKTFVSRTMHYNVTPSQRHLNYAGRGGIYKLRLEQHLIYSSAACVVLDVAKGLGIVGQRKVLTKRIYREHIIRPRLVCKSILI